MKTQTDDQPLLAAHALVGFDLQALPAREGLWLAMFARVVNCRIWSRSHLFRLKEGRATV